MMQTLRYLALVLAAAAVASAQAADPAPAQPAFTTVPFAVPVAVPVAVVRQPTLFYGVTRYAAAQESQANVSPEMPTSGEVPMFNQDPRLREQASAVLRLRCAECHQGSESRGGIVLFDDAGRLLAKLPRHSIAAATMSSGQAAPAMPPAGRDKLTAEEWQIVERWARLPKTFAY